MDKTGGGGGEGGGTQSAYRHSASDDGGSIVRHVGNGSDVTNSSDKGDGGGGGKRKFMATLKGFSEVRLLPVKGDPGDPEEAVDLSVAVCPGEAVLASAPARTWISQIVAHAQVRECGCQGCQVAHYRTLPSLEKSDM